MYILIVAFIAVHSGKTHLAISIGYSVAIRRNSVYFIKFNKLINILKTAYNEGMQDIQKRSTIFTSNITFDK